MGMFSLSINLSGYTCREDKAILSGQSTLGQRDLKIILSSDRE